MVSSLEQLKSTSTTVVADTGEFSLIAKYKPQDATTNPSLILAASKKPEYSQLIDDAIAHVKASGFKGDKHEAAAEAMDALLVNFGIKILEQVPGRVSTEVDARLSFDTNATVEKAVKVIKQYEAQGISKERVLIKIASTYEGIQAAKILESQHGIHCNLTLLFAQVQAIAAAEANATLISPFVGRILDWFKKNTNEEYSAANDPGVISVKGIYNYYKKFGYKTIVMGASFRSIGEITELAGVDYLTIAPALLEKLQNSEDPIPKKLDAQQALSLDIEKQEFLDHEAKFRFALNQDQMATEKLSEGIRNFAKDTDALLDILAAKF